MTVHLAQWQQATIPNECSGLRLDVVLSKLFDISRASLQRMIEEGLVHVNGVVQKKRHIVKEGDLLSLCPPLQAPSQVVPEEMSFDILYEDSSLFIINKPPGLVVHPAPGNRSGTFVNGLVAHCKDLECCDPVRPGLVHRLDKDTSGVLIAAKTLPVLGAMSKQFHDRTVHKEYLAIVVGKFEGNKQTSGSIGRSSRNRQRMAVVPEGKEAQTEFFPIVPSDVGGSIHVQLPKEYTLVKAIPRTGRTHQVRVHLAFLGYPILGDALYGNREANEKRKGVRQMLHCWSLTFVHPVTGETLLVKAPLPDDMNQFFITE